MAASFAIALAVTACETVDLGDVPPAPAACRPDFAYYRDIIWPEYIDPATAPERGCVSESGCHQQANGRSALRLIASNPPSATEHQSNYDVVTRFLNCGTPEASAMLTKPLSGVDPHGGGDLFGPSGQEETVFLQWFDN